MMKWIWMWTLATGVGVLLSLVTIDPYNITARIVDAHQYMIDMEVACDEEDDERARLSNIKGDN